MNIEEIQKKLICECGFQAKSTTHLQRHKQHCKIWKKFKIQQEEKARQEKESRRLPNGMFICENPECSKEHDGSYGSGRFCSKTCVQKFASQQSIKSRKEHHFARKASRAKFGTWKCKSCDFVGSTRYELQQHHKQYPDHRLFGSALKGLTKEICPQIAKASDKLKNRYATGELIPFFKGKHHTEESKKKLSSSMKKAHAEGRAYCWVPNQEASFPEIYFQELFKKENIDLKYHLQVSRYQLDFYNEEKMFYVEIDGEQHYRSEDRIQHDKDRRNYLRSIGWTEYRIRWSNWQKLSYENKHKIVEDIRNKLL